MLAYQFNLPVDESRAREVAKVRERSKKAKPSSEGAPSDALEQINRELGRRRANEDWFLFVCQKSADGLMMIAASRRMELDSQTVEAVLRDFFRDANIHTWKSQVMDFHEITLASLIGAMKLGEERDLINSDYRFYPEMGLKAAKEYFMPGCDREGCQIVETVSSIDATVKDEVLRHARLLLGHRSLMEELSRIYCRENRRTFMVHPVHYLIRANSSRSAQILAELLVSALHANGRLLGKRITYLSDFNFGYLRKRGLHDILIQIGRSTAVLELFDENASRGSRISGRSNEDFEACLKEEFRKQQDDTLFLFVAIGSKPDKKQESFLRGLLEGADIVTIREGSGREQETRDCLQEMARLYGQEPFSEAELETAVPEGVYTLTETGAIYRRLAKERMWRESYPAYRNLHFSAKKRQEEKRASKRKKSSESLQNLVGLQDVKELVRQIVASNQLRKLRSTMGMKPSSKALHMVFTGNPGSAKTTVARLLAGILKEEGISATGAFVECGRADLVGRYVGWTAKIVREKFEEATGGVLFIDEAYALVDSSRSFGAEAINTIVQEMENRRDEVLVIFAGYPDRMREFLDSNEGFRSRIAFHLDFPDYTADEMVGILQVMAAERELRLNPAILQKCRDIFEDAVKQEDFGNGRYVRNLLDAAVIRQADRLVAESTRSPITKQKAAHLSVKDFAPIKIHRKKEQKRREVGFRFAVDGKERE